jgi:hypothetical protein
MGRSIAAFYSPDDGLEHALQVTQPFWPSLDFHITDYTFNPLAPPGSQGAAFVGIGSTPSNTLRTVGATYCPIDGYRYGFGATADNKIFWSRFTNQINPARNPIVTGSTLIVNELIGYPPSSIADIAAYFTGGHLEVLVLMRNGHLWRMGGEPWSGNLSWSLIPFWASFTGGRRLAVFERAGWGHVMIAKTHEIIEVYYTWNHWGSVNIWTFNQAIIDVGAFYTPEDGVAHVIAAAWEPNQSISVQEITFVPAQVPPRLRQLGTVNFLIDSLGAYETPDLGRHIIMLEHGTPPKNLYLSWYYPGWEGFQYSLWPPLNVPG